MVVTQTLFQTKGAGDGFRRFRLRAEGDWLRVDRVDDLAALKPFPGAASRTSTIVLTKGAPTAVSGAVREMDARRKTAATRQEPLLGDGRSTPERPGSPWLIATGRTARHGAESRAAGPSDYAAHLGANSGGANAVYWLRLLGTCAGGVRGAEPCGQGQTGRAGRASRRSSRTCSIRCSAGATCGAGRPGRRPISSWPKTWTARTGIAEAVMRRELSPHATAICNKFEALSAAGPPIAAIRGRSRSTRCTTSAPTRWRRSRWCGGGWSGRSARRWSSPSTIRCLGRRPVVPQETCVLIACDSADEAHYLCAVLNSQRPGALVAAHSVVRRQGFWHARHVGVPRPAAFRRQRPAARGLGRLQPPGARASGGVRRRGGLWRVCGRAGDDRPPGERTVSCPERAPEYSLGLPRSGYPGFRILRIFKTPTRFRLAHASSTPAGLTTRAGTQTRGSRCAATPGWTIAARVGA